MDVISVNIGNRSLNILWIAESNWLSGSGIKPHLHDYYHMFMVRQGPLSFVIEDETCQLDKGAAILARPGVIHGLKSEIPMGRVYELKFTAQSPGLKSLLESIPSQLPPDPFAESLVRELVAESCLQEPSGLTFMTDYLLSLINYYSRHYGTTAHHTTSTIDTSGFSPVSQKIAEYLEANYAREVPLHEIAEVVGFNKNYTCSVFKRDSGMTIGTCQTLIRIRKAAELISFSDMNLAQVANATGFTNLSHFNRIFKKVVGIPPGQYRRMFAADMLFSSMTDENTQSLVGQNGFIISVLGKKRLSISDILEYTSHAAAEEDKEEGGA